MPATTQRRVRTRVPPPQVLLQAPHAPHEVHDFKHVFLQAFSSSFAPSHANPGSGRQTRDRFLFPVPHTAPPKHAPHVPQAPQLPWHFLHILVSSRLAMSPHNLSSTSLPPSTHLRCLVDTHWLHEPQAAQLAGHGPVLQSSISTLFPVHTFPPCSGLGFVQVRVRFILPMVPHLPRHDVHVDQLLHPPFTGPVTIFENTK